jgi:diphthine-ammonia ligase
MPGLKIIALVSGGKDSMLSMLYSLSQNNQNKIVALANIRPKASESDQETLPSEDCTEESYMYQKVGYNIIPYQAEAMGLPLHLATMKDNVIDSNLNYTAPDDYSDTMAARSDNSQDEVESMLEVLTKIISSGIEADAVSLGAILSDYQRTRVESVALRLGLIVIAPLWHFPELPFDGSSDSSPLLASLRDSGLEARIIKTASGALGPEMLWANLSSAATEYRMINSMKRIGAYDQAATLGEGGEYESIVVDGPWPIWKSRIEIASEDRQESWTRGVGEIKFSGAKLVKKDPREIDWQSTLRIPKLWDKEFQSLQDLESSKSTLKDSVVVSLKPYGVKIYNPPNWNILVSDSQIVLSNILSSLNPACLLIPYFKTRIEALKELLYSYDLTSESIISSTLLVRDQSTYSLVNDIYGSLFSKPLPPARAAVFVGDCLNSLSQTSNGEVCDVSLSLVISRVSKGEKVSKRGLHVQSRSYWAPANIGPYSQAIHQEVPFTASSIAEDQSPQSSFNLSIVHIAGQIPLEPISMTLWHSERPHELESTLLALQHVWRVATVQKCNWLLTGVLFVASTDISGELSEKALQERVTLASRVWEERLNQAKSSLEGSSNSDNDDEHDADFDIWHRQNNRYDAKFNACEQPPPKRTLPDWALLDEGETRATPFFAAVVSALPRSAPVEWLCTGLAFEWRTEPQACIEMTTKPISIREAGYDETFFHLTCIRNGKILARDTPPNILLTEIVYKCGGGESSLATDMAMYYLKSYTALLMSDLAYSSQVWRYFDSNINQGSISSLPGVIDVPVLRLFDKEGARLSYVLIVRAIAER